MPEMEFLKNTTDDQIKALQLTALMFFPKGDDEEVRKDWILKALLALAGTDWAKIKNGDEDLSSEIGQWLGRAVFRLGGWDRFCKALIGQNHPLRFEEQVRRRVGMGIEAGWILRILLSKGPLSPSVERACQEIAIKWRKEGPPPPGIKVSRDATRLRSSVWPAMRPASHLWAAYLVPNFSGKGEWLESPGLPILPLWDFPGGLDVFLALAEHYRSKGESRKPATSSLHPFLRPGHTWSVPPDYELPDLNELYMEVLR